MHRLLLALCPLLMTGCATVGDVWPLEDHSYMVTATALPVMGGAARAKQFAITKAENFCAQKNYRMVEINRYNDDLTRKTISGSFYHVGKSYSDDWFKYQRDNVVFQCREMPKSHKNLTGTTPQSSG